MEYEIAVGNSSENLEKVVAEMISEGWKPQGGIVAYTSSTSRLFGTTWNVSFAQAMVKEEK